MERAGLAPLAGQPGGAPFDGCPYSRGLGQVESSEDFSWPTLAIDPDTGSAAVAWMSRDLPLRCHPRRRLARRRRHLVRAGRIVAAWPDDRHLGAEQTIDARAGTT